jgi:glycosyltransferase involved in cell wall biosynthesis
MTKCYQISFSKDGGAGKSAGAIDRLINSIPQIDSKHINVIEGDLRKFRVKLIIIQFYALIDKYIIQKNHKNTLFSIYRFKYRTQKTNMIKSVSHSSLFFHWNAGCIEYKDLNEIVSNSNSITFVLHDAETFTGGCHFPNNCTQFVLNCSGCPQVHKIFQRKVSKNFQLKLKEISQIKNLNVVSPSKWLLAMAKESKILENANFHHIPNPIDLKIDDFNQINDSNFKEERISAIKRVGFIAADILEKRKGFKLLIETMDEVTKKFEDIELIVIGGISRFKKINRKYIVYKNYIESRPELVKEVSAIDLLIMPSYEDNFPNIILEVSSLGIPVLARKIGGISEIIEHGSNGFLFEQDEFFKEELIEVLQRKDLKEIGLRAKDNIEKNYSNESIAKIWTNFFSQNKN